MWLTNSIIAIMLLTSTVTAQLIQTLSTSERRHLDSLNLDIESIRLNQTGYRTDVEKKSAFVELSSPDLEGQAFLIVDADGETVYESTLEYLGDFMHLNGEINITGYYSSIVKLYHFESTPDASEYLYEAAFGDLQTNGTYRIVVNQDTSFQFEMRENIYNDIFELSLHYFGIQRSGDTESWFHPKSHTMDGSARGSGKEGSLAGGWFDCGDHFKVAQTTAYTFMNLTLTYLFWPEKSEDRYGHSYAQTAPHANDGIPDLLWEAKIGADYIYKLYVASVEDGLIENNDMYQQVGVSLEDHKLWIRPEFQDYQPRDKGGPDRKVDAEIGADMGGQFAGTLAFFASAWEKYDRNYSKKLLDAAIDIYENIVLYDVTRKSWSDAMFYPVQGQINDDLAMGALGLWYATGDPQYKYDLMENEDFGIGNSSEFNMDEFHAGFLAATGSIFSPGGWMSDYQNSHLQVIAAMYLLFYKDSETADKWGISESELSDTQERIITLLKKRLVGESAAGNGRTTIVENLDVVEIPYNLRWTSIGWGFNRYNMGAVIPVAMTAEILELANDPMASFYRDVVVDNLDYVLGKNPWNISFVVGAGEKNLQHIHHRGSNPEGYNAGGVPYEYTIPLGAFMAGSVPGSVISDVWYDYTNTETCIDYSSQLLMVSQLLSKELPEDTKNPSVFKIIANPVNITTATIRLENDELTNDSLSLYLDSTKAPIDGTFLTSQDKKVWNIEGLEPHTRYWVKLESKDVFENEGEDVWVRFTTTSEKVPPNWEEAGVCKVSHKSATIHWWSPNQFDVSGVFWGESQSEVEAKIQFIEEEDFGSFHQIDIHGLKPNTVYYYSRISGDSIDTNDGKYYTFTTREAFVNYSLYVKPVKKSGATAIYLEITNDEQAAYAGLELRLFLEIDEYDIDDIKVSTYDKQIFDVGGLPQGSNFTIGEFVTVDASENQYYLPITVDDTIPSAGRARMDLIFKIVDKDGSESNFDVENIKDSWSFTPKNEPEEYAGLPWEKMDIYTSPDPVEMVNGEAETTYILNQFVPVYYKGVHVYGYPPNWGDNKINSLKTFEISTESPFYMDADRVTTYLNTDFLSGSVTVFPHGTITDIEINGDAQKFELGSADNEATFSVQEISQYDPIVELVTWSDKHTEDCSYEYKKWIIDPKDREESSSSEEEFSSDEIHEDSSLSEEAQSSSSEVLGTSSHNTTGEEPEISVTTSGSVFELYIRNKLYNSNVVYANSSEGMSIDPSKDLAGVTIEVVETPHNFEEYSVDFEGYVYALDGQFIDNFFITKTGTELNEHSDFSIRFNSRDDYGNIKNQSGRTIGTGVYLLSITITERSADTRDQSFLLEKIGYLKSNN